MPCPAQSDCVVVVDRYLVDGRNVCFDDGGKESRIKGREEDKFPEYSIETFVQVCAAACEV